MEEEFCCVSNVNKEMEFIIASQSLPFYNSVPHQQLTQERPKCALHHGWKNVHRQIPHNTKLHIIMFQRPKNVDKMTSR